MIFPYATTENKIQIFEKIRIDASKTFSPDEAITKIEFLVDTLIFDITAKKIIDYAFITPGQKLCEIKGYTATTSQVFTFTIDVKTSAQEKLLSNDSDLMKHQHDLYKYLPESRNNFNYAHRRALSIILSDLDDQGFVLKDQSKVTENEILDISEFKELSIFTALRLIFADFSNIKDDLYDKKSSYYEKYERLAKLRCVQRIDFNKDGIITGLDIIDKTTIRAYRQ
jgi:hypothetical protein